MRDTVTISSRLPITRITHHASRIKHHKSRITTHQPRITPHDHTNHASRLTHHASRITHPASRITNHASRITHHVSFFLRPSSIIPRMTTALVYDPVFLEHDTRHHPENPDRLRVILSALKQDETLWTRLHHHSPRPVSDEDIMRCH